MQFVQEVFMLNSAYKKFKSTWFSFFDAFNFALSHLNLLLLTRCSENNQKKTKKSEKSEKKVGDLGCKSSFYFYKQSSSTMEGALYLCLGLLKVLDQAVQAN